MEQEQNADSDHEARSFEQEAEEKAVGLIREFWDFLKYNKKWWLLPIVLALLILGVLVILGGTAAMPFIYPIF